MSRTINPIRKRIVKRELKKGTDAKKAQIIANYSPNYAHKSTSNKVVKVCQAEISKEFDASRITVDYVLAELNKTIEDAKEWKDNSSRVKCLDLFGKWLRMWKDKDTTVNIFTNSHLDTQYKASLDNLRGKESIPQVVPVVPIEVVDAKTTDKNIQPADTQEVSEK